MSDFKLGLVESKFADIIWGNEPLTTSELVKICSSELEWKRTTTYTVLKRLIDRGIFQNNDGMVSSIVSRNEFYSMQSEKFVEEAFDGSLPAFIAAFTSRKSLSEDEIAQIRQMIDSYGEG